jgi:hypothetical protein
VTFWLGVAVAYIVIISTGLAIGRFLGERYGRGRGGNAEPTPAPTAPKPAFGATFDVPALGSAFDRALLPGAFAEVAAEALTG